VIDYDARLRGAVTPDTAVLEIGCGTGNYIGALHTATAAACSYVAGSTM
jgi:protein-L-isoaspartate O-methyltransferase